MTENQVKTFLHNNGLIISKETDPEAYDYNAINTSIFKITLDNPGDVFPDSKAQIKKYYDATGKAAASGTYIHKFIYETNPEDSYMLLRDYVTGDGAYYEGAELKGIETMVPLAVIQRMAVNISLGNFISYALQK